MVFAGLIPHLRREGSWLITSLRPSDRPFHSLALALMPLLEPQMSERERLLEGNELAQQLQESKLTLRDIVELITQRQLGRRFLLVIDQFEELYTLYREPEVREHFLDELAFIVQAVSEYDFLNFRLLLTLRTDFLGQALDHHRPIAVALQSSNLLLPSLSVQELQDTIRKPAEALNVKIEEGLTERILQEVKPASNRLPLLEFALTLLWNKQKGGRLTHAGYVEIGGVEKALTDHAEQVFAELSEDEQNQAQRVFMQLVRFGEGTEDTRRLATRSEIGEENWKLVMHLSSARARLVVNGRDQISGEETVEVVHEALISRWQRLREWIENNHEFRTWQERLRAAMRQWEKSNREDGALLRGFLLEEATSWMAQYGENLSQKERTFIESSQQLEKLILAIKRINRASNSTTDLDQSLEIIAQVVAEELHVDLCSIFFYDEFQRLLTLRATNGSRPLGGMHYTLRPGEGYSGWVADKETPLLVRDALADPHFSSEASAYTHEYHGLMAIPVIFNAERLIGVISVQSADERKFTAAELNFVEDVASIVAINIEIGRLSEQTNADEGLRRKVYELATIHRVYSIITSTLDLDEVLQITVIQAVQLSGAERSCIFGLDTEKQQLYVWAHYGINSTDLRHIQIPVGQCCAGRTVQTGRPSIAVDCFHSDEHCFLNGDPGVSADIHSVLCVPLQVKRKVLGCICIYSSNSHPLSHEQMQLVITFANEAAIAIENARLYDETRRGLELKSVLLRELHHRVKNNLATVAGILSLQRRRTKSPEVRNTLAESVNRVQGLAATYDLLAHEDVSKARVEDIARKIVGVSNANLRPPEKQITFEVEPCPIVIPSRAVTVLALVLIEMISNAIIHGLAGMTKGIVTIRGHEEDSMVVVEVLDTGNGPAELSDEESSEGLGLSLIRNLIGELEGRFILRRTGESPPRTCAEVRFTLAQRL